jgi:Bromodomain
VSDISNALRLITAPALVPADGPNSNMGGRGACKGAWGVVNLLTQEEGEGEEEEEGRNTQQGSSAVDRDGLNTQKDSRNRYNNSRGGRGTASATLLDSLRTLALFSGGDFRACVQTLLLSVPLYQDTEAMREMRLKVPSVSQGGWSDVKSLKDSSSMGSYIAWGATRKSLLFPAFDRQGDRLASLLHSTDVTYALPSTSCDEEISTDSNVLSPSNDAGLAVKSLENYAVDGNNYPAFSGLVVPVVMSLSPTQCLVAGGELITISGKHFLQRKLNKRSLQHLETGIGILEGGSPKPQGVPNTQVSDSLDSSVEGAEEGEAQRLLERIIVRVEVLVNEVPVPADRVFLMSDSELSFIFPSTTAGVATVVVMLVDDLDRPSAPLDLDGNSVSACLELCTLSLTPFPSYSRQVVVRSDTCGSAGGGVMVRDRRMKDIRLFFAPRKPLSSRDKELDKERYKDKNTSFFMTEGFGARGKKGKDSKWDEVEEDIWEDDVPSSFDKNKTRQSKREREREEEEVNGLSSDSDAFIDAPPRSSSSRTMQKTLSESSRSKEGRKEATLKNVPTSKRLRNNRPALDLVTHTAVTITQKGEEQEIVNGNMCNVDIDNDADFLEDDPPLPVTAKVIKVTSARRSRCVIDDDEEEEEEEEEDKNKDKEEKDEDKDVKDGDEEVHCEGTTAEGTESTGLLGPGSTALALPSKFSQDRAALSNALTEALSSCLAALIAHPLSDPFREPVDPVQAPDYLTVIKTPMDLSTVQSSLDEGLYTSEEESGKEYVDVPAFLSDTRQIWLNCRKYNHHSDAIVKQANVLQDTFERTLYETFEDLSKKHAQIEQAPKSAERTVGCVTATQDTVTSIDPAESVQTAPPGPSPTQCLLDVKAGVVKIVLGTLQYEVTFPLPVKEVVEVLIPSTAPKVSHTDLLALLVTAERERYEALEPRAGTVSCPWYPNSVACVSYVPAGIEYSDADVAQPVSLHRYPSLSSCALYSTLKGTVVRGANKESDHSSDPSSHPRGGTAVMQIEDSKKDSELYAHAGDTGSAGSGSRGVSDIEGVRAVELGCLAALESMWEHQHSFSTCDMLGTVQPVIDCFYTPSSSSSSGPGASTCNEEESGVTHYDTSVEGSLWQTRQRGIVSSLSDREWGALSANIKTNASHLYTAPSSSSFSSSTTLYGPHALRCRSFRSHILCLDSESKHRDPLPNLTANTVNRESAAATSVDTDVSYNIVALTHRPVVDLSLGLTHSGSQSHSRDCSRNGSTVGSQSQEEDNEDSDDSSDGEAAVDEEDEEAIFMEECRRVENSSSSSASISGAILTGSAGSTSSSAGIAGGIMSDSVAEGRREKLSPWCALGADLDSSYLRYCLRKKELEMYVNDTLCGEDGPFDNGCSSSLCPAMALDLLPMLGRMARSEADRDNSYAEVAAVVRAGGGNSFDPFGKKIVSTRRSSLSVRARFQHLACATQLSESSLEALLMYGYVAGGR